MSRSWSKFSLVWCALWLATACADDSATGEQAQAAVAALMPAPTNCTADQQGADDEPGQKDLSEFCQEDGDGAPFEVHTSWNFDDTRWTGANTGDACALYDTDDADSFANFAVCVTVEDGPPAVMQAGNPKLYSCGNDRVDRCTGSVLLTTGGTVCEVNDPTEDADPFAGRTSTSACAGADCLTEDTLTTCWIDEDDFGGEPVTLTDVCSFPSQQPNSDPSDCILTPTGNDPCQGVDCDDQNACTADSCDPGTGACINDPITCDDGDSCTADACDPATGCTTTPTDCDDGNACTADACDPATGCSNTPVVCDDGDACTADSCDPATGCSTTPISCDDANACTADACDPATGCSNTPVVCDDGNACTADSCDPATGCGNTPISCDDGNACTADACDPATGCTNAPVSCDDGNACTADACDPATGCSNTPVVCDDGDACTADSCDPATGCATTPVVCDDGNACTADSCDPATGCGNTPVDCDDGNACTADSCDPATGCGNTPVSCDDGNACTADACDPATGCSNTPVVCDDGDACTADSCDPATGCGNTPIDCNDGDACTADSCDPATGCATTPISCNDGNACTADSCDPATGCANTVISCDDGNACTADSCDPATGCANTVISCDDGNACTADSCEPATGCANDAISCDDNVPCTDDLCDPVSGCFSDASMCTEICRTAGFWGTHPQETQGVLDWSDGISVCGMHIGADDPPQGFSCAVEGLCVRPRGDQQLIAARQLVAAALNCELSTGNGACEGTPIEDVFAQCDAACAANDGATLSACTPQIDCFNNGGQWIEGIGCALGTCSLDAAACGADAGECDDTDPSNVCNVYVGNCHDAPLDATSILMEPPAQAESQACRAATNNDKKNSSVTLFDCGTPL